MNFLQKQTFNRAAIMANNDWAGINTNYRAEIQRRQSIDWTQWNGIWIGAGVVGNQSAQFTKLPSPQ